jgi:hypothetical protein
VSYAVVKGFGCGEGLPGRDWIVPVVIVPVVMLRMTTRFRSFPFLRVRLWTGLGWLGLVGRAPGLGLVGRAPRLGLVGRAPRLGLVGRTGAWWSRSCRARIHGSLETGLLAKESIGARHIPFSADR